MKEIINKINTLKKEKNAVILAHCYQNVEIDEVADFVGDSLYLSRQAAKTDAEIIIFAGVYFMAQVAKMLSPQKRVFLPRMESGCLMADMITLNDLREFKSQHPNIPTVCYINSTAEVKTECDICVTSSNAVDVIRSLNVPEVLFLPDTYLGKWVESQLHGVKVITYPGFCPTHMRIRPSDIENARTQLPNAKVLAHPECKKEITDIADFVGSTKDIMNFVKNSSYDKFIIATEKGVTDRLTRDYPGKTFIPAAENLICPNMKWNTLPDIYNVLLNEENEIFVDEEVSKKAVNCINKMLEVTEKCLTK